MDRNDWVGICAFHRRSHYDIIQEQTVSGYGRVWTFAPCNPQAAAQAAAMLRRAGTRRIRHSRRACLKMETMTIDAVVFTEMPSGRQTILRLVDGSKVKGIVYLRDECLEVLEAVFD